MGFIFRKKFAISEDDLFPQILLDDLAELPIKTDKNANPDNLKFLVQEEEIKVESLFFFELLNNLTGKIIEQYKQQKKLRSALDPFKFLNKGVRFKRFSDVFSEAIKYGRQFTGEIDIGAVHHDIEGLQLHPQNSSDDLESSDESAWLLSLQLKHRDPETGWADWLKEDGKIVRSTQPVYQFELTEKEGRYWQQAFEVLGEFTNFNNFPSGKTRTTHEKLMISDVPIFNANVEIEKLVELREELADINQKIEKTDWLIDQVVYQLYGLSEEEIEIVEGNV
jgi:hypothetical protein